MRTFASRNGRVVVSLNDWAGTAVVSWESPGVPRQEAEIPANSLLSGWVPQGCVAPQWVLCQAVALAVREDAFRAGHDAGWNAGAEWYDSNEHRRDPPTDFQYRKRLADDMACYRTDEVTLTRERGPICGARDGEVRMGGDGNAFACCCNLAASHAGPHRFWGLALQSQDGVANAPRR